MLIRYQGFQKLFFSIENRSSKTWVSKTSKFWRNTRFFPDNPGFPGGKPAVSGEKPGLSKKNLIYLIVIVVISRATDSSRVNGRLPRVSP